MTLGRVDRNDGPRYRYRIEIRWDGINRPWNPVIDPGPLGSEVRVVEFDEIAELFPNGKSITLAQWTRFKQHNAHVSWS